MTSLNLCHISALMKTISIRELHMNTGKWVRVAAESMEPVVISDRGQTTAWLQAVKAEAVTSFSERRLVDGYARLPRIDMDTAALLEEDRR